MPEVRFCSACGAELPSPPPVVCAGCGTEHWRNPKPCANAIVVERDRVLLIRRAHAPWQGMWSTPGGFCERSEHPIVTVEREVREETGLEVRVTGYVGVWIDDYADEPGDSANEIINVAYYLAEPVRGDSGSFDPREVSELGWFTWGEFPTELAPPRTLAAVLDIARRAVMAPILDRPRES